MIIFERSSDAPHRWVPSPLAAGPFAGVQGGAVAGLLTGEVEALAGARGWGEALSASAWFLRPTPLAPLRSQVNVVAEGGRVSVVDNTLYADDPKKPGAEVACATVRVTLARARAVEVPGFREAPRGVAVDPALLPLRTRRAMHGGPWFMDAMEVRAGDGILWFALKADVVAGAGALARVLGPADWTHGIARPVENAVADPNPNLTVQLFRAPEGAWIGVRATTQWAPARGVGLGRGTLFDVHGEIGCVSMAVALTPFPKSVAVVA